MTEDSRLRVALVGVIAISLFSALFARLWYLQVVSGDRYAVEAEGNRVRIVYTEAPRGRILDRHGRPLVENRVVNVVTVSRLLTEDQQAEVISRLVPVLGVPRDELADRVEEQRFSDHRPIPVATDVPEEIVVYIREHQAEFDGVEAAQAAVRHYPHGEFAAHVLGYVGEINDEELEIRRDEGYRLGDRIGKTGVERAYERELRGVPGIEKLEVDSRGRVLRSLGMQEPQQGHDVQLSLDLDVQRAAEEALVGHIEVARGRGFAAPAGAVVVLDPRDGSVVAMASHPTFNPAGFVHGIRSDVWDALNDPASNFPLNNRAIQAQYAPASTFKLITGVAGLTSGLIDPSTTFNDQGSIQIGNRRFHNARSRSYGPVDLRRAVTVSSDVYFYNLGWRIWQLEGDASREIQRVARAFGLDEPTGIELPFEQDGRVPDPEWKRRVHELNPEIFPEGRWYAGDNVNLAIGQGDVLVTPLQLARAYAILANAGTVFEPRVGARVLDRFGTLVREIPPVAVGRAPLPPGGRETILAGMRGTVAAAEGTAAHAFVGFPLREYPVAGKTGTAQVRDKRETSLFVGVMPADQPRYVALAVVEEAGGGSEVAAPIVRAVLEALISAEETPPLPTTTPPLGPRRLPAPLPTDAGDGRDPSQPGGTGGDGVEQGPIDVDRLPDAPPAEMAAAGADPGRWWRE